MTESHAARCLRLLIAPVLAYLVVSGPAHAQQPAASASQAAQSAASAAPVTTLDKVQALRPDEEILDPYTFKNPISVDPTRFDKAYNTGITPEQMGRDPRDGGYGGYVNYGINMGLLQTWKGIKQLTHMRPYEQPAIARPPPLDEEQMRRAARASDVDEDAGGK